MGDLSGMTGFARHKGGQGDDEWVMEARSVNGKSLDVRVRLPSDLLSLEQEVRKCVVAQFKRGNVQINLTLRRGSPNVSYEINEEWYDKLADFSHKRHGLDHIAKDLFLVPGVIVEKHNGRSDDEENDLNKALIEDFKELIDQLKKARDGEGVSLKPVLIDEITHIKTLISEAETTAASQPEAIKVKLLERIKLLESEDIPQDRLAPEMALLAQKADVREEIDRLKAHCDQAIDLVEQGSPVGRKIDFLCQEFNREANTLCSKSQDVDLTKIGLELKNTVEQFREQAANVE